MPKTDSQVQRLLATREDVFPDYDQESLERTFGELFILRAKERIEGSERTLYRFEARSAAIE